MGAPEEEAAALLTAALGSGLVESACTAALWSLLPGATFVRASVRCGTGLLVSGDLLRPGHTQLSVASLQQSLAGMAMAQRQPVVVAAPNDAGSGDGTTVRQVLCVPVALKPVPHATIGSSSSGTGSHPAEDEEAAAHPPLYVGALMVGCAVEHGSCQPAPPALWAAVHALADAAAPYLLLLGVSQAEEMAALLRLRAADCGSCGDEQDALQDLPLEACAPPPPPGGSAGSSAGALSAAAMQAAAAGAGAASGEGKGAAAETGQRLQAAAAAAALAKHTAAAVEQQGNRHLRWQAGRRGLSPVRAWSRRRSWIPRRLSALQAGGFATSPPPAQPHALLLHFLDPAVEARFAAAHNRSLLRSDALFAALHLSAALCLAVLHPALLLASRPVQIFVAALLAPVVARLLDEASYLRHRELANAFLLLVHAALLRSASMPSLLRMLPEGTLGVLPWVLRVTGAEALAVFPIGFKLRFHLFLPLQALCLAIMFTALQPPCETLPGGRVCLPEAMRLPGAAALFGLGGLLPAAMLHRFESRARQRFLSAEHHMRTADA